MNARYYQPSTGRFLTQDTYSGSMDLYNNAVGIAIGSVADRYLSNDDLASLVYDDAVTEGQGRWIYP